MDSDFRVDLNEIIRSVETAEVLSIYFPLLRKALLVDARSDAAEGPMMRVMPMVNNLEERFRSLKRLRPRFPVPENVALIPWPKYAVSLKRLGVWERLLERFAASGFPGILAQCEQAYQEIAKLERDEISAALTGERYQSLWERRR